MKKSVAFMLGLGLAVVLPIASVAFGFVAISFSIINQLYIMPKNPPALLRKDSAVHKDVFFAELADDLASLQVGNDWQLESDTFACLARLALNKSLVELIGPVDTSNMVIKKNLFSYAGQFVIDTKYPTLNTWYDIFDYTHIETTLPVRIQLRGTMEVNEDSLGVTIKHLSVNAFKPPVQVVQFINSQSGHDLDIKTIEGGLFHFTNTMNKPEGLRHDYSFADLDTYLPKGLKIESINLGKKTIAVSTKLDTAEARSLIQSMGGLARKHKSVIASTYRKHINDSDALEDVLAAAKILEALPVKPSNAQLEQSYFDMLNALKLLASKALALPANERALFMESMKKGISLASLEKMIF